MKIYHCKKCRTNLRQINHAKEMFIENVYYTQEETLELMKKPSVKIITIKQCPKCAEDKPIIHSKIPLDLSFYNKKKEK